MSEPIRYKDINHDSFWVKAGNSLGKKSPLNTALKVIVFPIWYVSVPLMALGSKYLIWNYKIQKMIKKKKYSEAFSFGIDTLSTWKEKKEYLKKGDWPPFQSSWWQAFESICNCALEISEPDALLKVEQVFEKRPYGNIGFDVASNLANISRVAWAKGEREKAWDLVNKAVSCDESYGGSYYLRAWFGEQLGTGQPVADLLLAIRNQPELELDIFKDEFFLQKSNLLVELKTGLKNLK